MELNEELQAELKKQAENLTEEAVNAVFAIVEKYIETTENKIDDAVIPFLPTAKAFVQKFVNKIDGEE